MADQSRNFSLPVTASRFQRVEWALQRVGWGLCVGILVAALAGLMGDGPLSHDVKQSPHGLLRVEFDRYLRYRTPTRLHVEAKRDDLSAGDIRIIVGTEYLDHLQISQITPEPLQQESVDGGCEFVFHASQSGGASIMFDLEPDQWGTVRGTLTAGDDSVLIEQFVYP